MSFYKGVGPPSDQESPPLELQSSKGCSLRPEKRNVKPKVESGGVLEKGAASPLPTS